MSALAFESRLVRLAGNRDDAAAEVQLQFASRLQPVAKSVAVRALTTSEATNR